MKLKLHISLMVFCCLLLGTTLSAQTEEDHSYKPLKLNLNDDGSKYVRFIMWHQIWATSNNLSNDSDFSVTPSIRRSRFLAFAQVSPRFLILTHFGLNNLGTGNLTPLGNDVSNGLTGYGPQFFLHDAWGEFKISDELYVGGGLHYWKGMTRMSNQSTLNMMTMDNSRPFAHWHSLGLSDQFARHLGFYAKGTIGDKFQYRLAANKRMNPANAIAAAGSLPELEDSTLVSNISIDGTGNGVYEGYLEYQIWDKESNKLPYKVGTYFGKKKILNVGAGFFAQPNGARDNTDDSDQNVLHFAGDVFMELPTAGGALNAYISFMNFNYGENFVGRWAGTGTNIYAHAGYYVKSANIMPYVAFQQGNYEGRVEPVTAVDAGVNYYINGHHAKLSLEYHSIINQLNNGTDVSQLRLQMHFFL